MIAGKRYHGLGSDIWSFGIILYAMTCGYLPFEDPNTNKLYKKILACDFHIPSFITSSNKDLIQKVLTTDPTKRYRIQDIRGHDWYNKIRSVALDGIVIGKDKIPIIQEQLDDLKQHFQGDNLAQAATFVHNNKHNQVTSTYYLLIKRRERQTGKNYVYEQVTLDKQGRKRSTPGVFKQSTTTVADLQDSKDAVVNPRRIVDFHNKTGGLSHTMPLTSKARNQSSPHGQAQAIVNEIAGSQFPVSRGAQSHSPKSLANKIYEQSNPMNLRQTGVNFSSISNHQQSAENNYQQ